MIEYTFERPGHTNPDGSPVIFVGFVLSDDAVNVRQRTVGADDSDPSENVPPGLPEPFAP